MDHVVQDRRRRAHGLLDFEDEGVTILRKLCDHFISFLFVRVDPKHLHRNILKGCIWTANIDTIYY